jgi:peptide/nickel transport system permease protein
MPGDQVAMMLPPNLRPEIYDVTYDAMFRRLGLDRPLYEQYFRWLREIFQGNWGFSSMFQGRPVLDVIAEPLRNTIILNIFVNIFYLLIALPVGIRMAVKRGSIFDNSWQVFSLATFSMPSFFIGLSLIFIFGINLGWLPLGGMPNAAMLEGLDYYIAWARHLVLPVTTLVLISLAGAIRYIRNAMIDALSQDYIKTARSKGLSEKVVIYSHAFRNALIPISTIVVGAVFALFGGAVVTESVFSYHGIGRLMVSAVTGRDRMLVVSLNMFYSMINVTAVLVADIVYGLIDPRIKLK